MAVLTGVVGAWIHLSTKSQDVPGRIDGGALSLESLQVAAEYAFFRVVCVLDRVQVRHEERLALKHGQRVRVIECVVNRWDFPSKQGVGLRQAVRDTTGDGAVHVLERVSWRGGDRGGVRSGEARTLARQAVQAQKRGRNPTVKDVESENGADLLHRGATGQGIVVQTR